MPIVTIKIHNKEFQLSCEQESKDRLVELAAQINDKLDEMAKMNPYASCELLLVMLALSLMDNQEAKIDTDQGIDADVNQSAQQQLITILSELKALKERI